MSRFFRNHILFLFICAFCSCGDSCPDGVLFLGDFNLSDYEKSLVPYTGFEDLKFIDKEGREITARTQPRELQDQKIDTGPEECESWESEELDNFVNFLAQNFSIRLKIEAFDNKSTFQISYNETDDPSGLEVLLEIVNPMLGEAENIELFGFSFQEVFVFKSTLENGKIDTILFSANGKGIELIVFNDGNYLKSNNF